MDPITLVIGYVFLLLLMWVNRVMEWWKGAGPLLADGTLSALKFFLFVAGVIVAIKLYRKVYDWLCDKVEEARDAHADSIVEDLPTASEEPAPWDIERPRGLLVIAIMIFAFALVDGIALYHGLAWQLTADAATAEAAPSVARFGAGAIVFVLNILGGVALIRLRAKAVVLFALSCLITAGAIATAFLDGSLMTKQLPLVLLYAFLKVGVPLWYSARANRVGYLQSV